MQSICQSSFTVNNPEPNVEKDPCYRDSGSGIPLLWRQKDEPYVESIQQVILNNTLDFT
jgi:hypothetical protein